MRSGGQGVSDTGSVVARLPLSSRHFKRPSKRSLLVSLFKYHRRSYAIMSLAMLASSALVGALAQIVLAAAFWDGSPGRQQMSAYESNMAAQNFSFMVSAAALPLISCVIISIFLILSSVAFLLEERRREYALLRLSGASTRRVRRMAVGDLVGGLLSIPLIWLVLRFLEWLFAQDSVIRPHPRWWCTLASCAGVLLTGLIGAWLASKRLAAVSPLEALGPLQTQQAKLTLFRIGLALVALVLGCALMTPLWTMNELARASLIGLCLLTAADAAAPWLLTRLGALIGLLLRAFGRGPGLLAARRATFGSRATTAIALPVMLMLVIVFSLQTVMLTFTNTYIIAPLKSVRADFVISADASQEATVGEKLRRADTYISSAETYRLTNWARPDGDTTAQVAEASLDQLQQAGGPQSTLRFVQGSPADLGRAG
ncbi:hypothetical protein KIM372_06880 [Bombiscardovia nodaiensis]|uniref:ABC3 transporter permease C-terminal domain-containing protein n=1 Tax=Bombiscardovia nodaiensis TaxID=2932181 RepID=A0ABM8B7C6_9BIFI|nr:hypothetical protein KIM372_06880 [Bombiscardovia nodaiensis]